MRQGLPPILTRTLFAQRGTLKTTIARHGGASGRPKSFGGCNASAALALLFLVIFVAGPPWATPVLLAFELARKAIELVAHPAITNTEVNARVALVMCADRLLAHLALDGGLVHPTDTAKLLAFSAVDTASFASDTFRSWSGDLFFHLLGNV